MKCPRDGTPMVELTKEHKCPKCGFFRSRFIKADGGSPLFVSLQAKNKETKKFLEDIGTPKQSWYLKDGLVFIKENGKIVDVRKAGDFADKLAKEIKRK